jgi:predicted O-methyltransferase YrrM
METNLPAVLLEALERSETRTADGRVVPLEGAVSLDEARFLGAVVRGVRPRCSVEIGLAGGVSTVAILQALEENGGGEHHVVDPYQANYGDAGLELVRAAGLERRMVFHRAFPEEVLPGLPSLDFVFIDGSHLFDLTLMEFVLADKKLAVGGLVAWHDLWMPSVQKAVRYVLANRAYRVAPGWHGAPGKSSAGWKRFVRRVLGRLPGAARVFRPEFLTSWRDFALPNLVVLEKMAADTRPWRFHREF